MAIDLNTIPDEEAEHHLPDLNGELLDEQADEVHVLQDEVLRLQEAQSQLLQEDEQVAMHGIDLNIDPSKLQQPNEGNVFSLLYQSTKAINHFIMWHID